MLLGWSPGQQLRLLHWLSDALTMHSARSKNLFVALAHQAKNLSNDKMADELRSLVSVTFMKFHIYVSAICKENLCFFECEGDIGNPLSSKK
jgi:hypothetical protein